MVEVLSGVSVSEISSIDMDSISHFVSWEICATHLVWLKKDDFLALEQGNIIVASYKAKFYTFSRYFT